MSKTHPLIPVVRNLSLLTDIAKTYGTPLFLYSEDQIVRNINSINQALKKHFNSFHICYAVKANSNPHLIRLMKRNLPNLGADCSSPGEIYAAKLAGIKPNECIYTGNYESQSDLQSAINNGLHINLDDINSFHRLKKITLPEEISFRLNPGFGKGSFAQIVTGGEKAKFGVPREKIIDAYRLAKETGVKKFGLQCMTGSGVLDPQYFPDLMKVILEVILSITETLGITFEYISMGGGYGIPYKEEDMQLDLDKVFNKVGKVFNSFFKEHHLQTPSLWIEPGKAVIGNSAILLARVTGIKHSYKNYIGLDCGMETLMRPALYGAYHKINKVGEPDAPLTFTADFTGQICENTDRLAVDRNFSEVNEGDLIAIMDAGAYGFSMSHNFNTRPRAAEVLLTGNETQLIRKRETIEDIFQNCNL